MVETMMRPVPRSFTFGKGFRTKLELLKGTEHWSRDELVSFQEKRLVNLVDHAYRTVPYYHDLMRSRSLHPGDVSKISDLGRLPPLTKEDIIKDRSALVSSGAAQYQPGQAFTSGSTGKPFNFLLDQQNREMELAAVWRHISWIGIKDLNARIASFRGSFIRNEGPDKLWKWDMKLGELAFNTYNINSTTIRAIAEELAKYRPQILKGYPHALYILSRTMTDAGITPEFHPELVLTSSECLSPHMRESIEETFGTTVYDYYGQSENIVSAGQCSQGLYHQVMETGILTVAEDEWGMERAIGTGLWNYSMPFINYEIGDCLSLGAEGCPCGRDHLTIGSIEGRINDIILTTSGNALSGVGMDNFYKQVILKGLTIKPEYFKFVQEKEDRYSIRLFSSKGISPEELNGMRGAFLELLGAEATIEIEQIDRVPPTTKWRTFESKLNLDSHLHHTG